MRKTIRDYISENEDLRQTLLSQQGGIMKYLAEHLDADGIEALFVGYQAQCVHDYRKREKWNIYRAYTKDSLERGALGDEHIIKELQRQKELEPLLTELSEHEQECISLFNDNYLTYAYEQQRRRQRPDGWTPRELYRELVEQYAGLGLAESCMKALLSKHHGQQNGTSMLTDFRIRQYVDHLTLGSFATMRQAVAEMLKDKTQEQCRKMAIDTMKRVRGFSQMIYTDEVVKHYREIKQYDSANERESDGKWLRDVAESAIRDAFSGSAKTSSMGYYFAHFVNLLIDLGRIWAAQLLVHGIDMKELETEVCCIMYPTESLQYYVDKYFFDDLPDDYCVSDLKHAETLLVKIGWVPPEDSTRENLVALDYPQESSQEGVQEEPQIPESLENIVFKQGCDLKRIWKWINDYFLPIHRYAYDWYALLCFLAEEKILVKGEDTTNESFASQINVWFPSQDCTAGSVKVYRTGYLSTTCYRIWNEEIFLKNKKSNQKIEGFRHLQGVCDGLQVANETDRVSMAINESVN